MVDIKSVAFGSCISLRALILEGTIPPILAHDAISGLRDMKIYVPEESLAQYKNAPIWTNYLFNIYPLSEIPSIYN